MLAGQKTEIGVVAFRLAMMIAAAGVASGLYLRLVDENHSAPDRIRASVSVQLRPPVPFTRDTAAGSSAGIAAPRAGAGHPLFGAGAATDGSRSAHPVDLSRVAFDVSDPYVWTEDERTAIEIHKALRVNGVDVGPAAIRVGEDSSLSIARDKLKEGLSRLGREDVAEQLGGPRSGGFVSFDEIRRRGVAVRYDAPSDRVDLTIRRPNAGVP